LFEIWITSPPHRDGLVAELQIFHGSTVDQPLEIFRKDGVLMIGLYLGGRTEPIELPLSEFLDVIAKASAGLAERE
jgi:hypothetical protein